MSRKQHSEVITFKVDDALKKAMNGISNRSAFIRTAILTALENLCPLCRGTGILNSHQQQNWEEFLKSHSLEKCTDCEALHISCKHEKMSKDQEK